MKIEMPGLSEDVTKNGWGPWGSSMLGVYMGPIKIQGSIVVVVGHLPGEFVVERAFCLFNMTVACSSLDGEGSSGASSGSHFSQF